MIKAILACDDKGAIGLNKSLPWPKNKEDMSWFKDQTTGHIVVMGSKTWLGSPLPNRKNVVVSKKSPEIYEGAFRVIGKNLLEEIKNLEEEFPNLIIWVIGGSHLFENLLPVISQLYLTRIPGEFDADTFIDLNIIDKNFNKILITDVRTASFEIWEKKKI